MPEIFISGPEGRLEARYMPSSNQAAPLALILHPEPNKGGNMNNRVSFAMYKIFQARGFSVMRFNFRGVGRSQGIYSGGDGELSDAASALDWIQEQCPGARSCWVGGFSFGSWIGMQLMMRRPEVEGFVSVTPPADNQDFSFLAPCPSSGLIVHGEADSIIPLEAVDKLVKKMSMQKGITIDFKMIQNANHYFTHHLNELTKIIDDYLADIKPEVKPFPADTN